MVVSSPADAQCGSQASSCKNCHEVHAQDPVNTEGDWHIAHAFGDFCEFCHAGNVQATDADTAHQAMVAPLADPKTSCSACHPNDARDLALVYATTLGVEVGTGSAGSAGQAASPTEVPTPTTAPPASAADLPAAGLIDFNAQYAATAEGASPVNVGNVILGVVIGAMVLGGGGFIVWKERRRRLPAAAPSDSAAEAVVPPTSPSSASAPWLDAVGALDPLGRRALERLLRDPQTASDLLRRLSRLDPDVIRTVRGLDRETRALLLALTSD
jgi:hypothetical protein